MEFKFRETPETKDLDLYDETQIKNSNTNINQEENEPIRRDADAAVGMREITKLPETL